MVIWLICCQNQNCKDQKTKFNSKSKYILGSIKVKTRLMIVPVHVTSTSVYTSTSTRVQVPYISSSFVVVSCFCYACFVVFPFRLWIFISKFSSGGGMSRGYG